MKRQHWIARFHTNRLNRPEPDWRAIGATRGEFFLHVRAGLRRLLESLAAHPAGLRDARPETIQSPALVR